jgi:hypothetical protein
MGKRGPKPGQANKGGRPKGSQNKITADLKNMILGALEKAGGEKYLVEQAKAKNPTAFLTLVGKIVPQTINANVNVLDKLSAEDLARVSAALGSITGGSEDTQGGD